MKNQISDGVLTLYFEGEVSSANATQVEGEAMPLVQKGGFTSLVLDFTDLNYISSAGLRILLKLKQRCNDVKIIGVSLSVYEILEMTGFTNIIPVAKAIKVISVEGAEVVGEGYFSTVYRIDKDTIVKVFNRVSDEDQIQRELSLAKEAFILGIPTAISYDIVRVGEKYGVRFEMLDCDSLRNVFRDNPGRYEELKDKYAQLLVTINSLEPASDSLPSIKAHYRDHLLAICPYLDEAQKEKLSAMLEAIPERRTFVHGDCHFKNIMVQNDELLLIDMDTLSYGHPIFEYANIFAPYIAFEEDDPGNNERFLGMPSSFTKKLFIDLVAKANGKCDQAVYDKIAMLSYIHMVWWTKANEPENEKRFHGCLNRLLALLDKYEDFNIE